MLQHSGRIVPPSFLGDFGDSLEDVSPFILRGLCQHHFVRFARLTEGYVPLNFGRPCAPSFSNEDVYP